MASEKERLGKTVEKRSVENDPQLLKPRVSKIDQLGSV